MTKYLLDSNTCIEVLRRGRQTPVFAKLAALSKSEVFINSVVVGELEYGALRSSDPAKHLPCVRQFCAGYGSLPFDDAAGTAYAQIRADLTIAGTPIGGNDMMIAAIAFANGLTMVTHNTRDFNRVPGLLIEDWQLP